MEVLLTLFHGTVFAMLSKRMGVVDLISSSWIENLVIFYFIGMVLSRIGSLIIAPILKKTELVTYAPYKDYKTASEKKPFILTLLKVNNTYRTFIATFLSMLVLKVCKPILKYDWIILLCLIVIYVLAFIKQTNFIRKSVEMETR